VVGDYSELSGGKHYDTNERNSIQSEEKQSRGVRQKYRRAFSISNLNRFFNNHCRTLDETVQFPFVPLPNVISLSERRCY